MAPKRRKVGFSIESEAQARVDAAETAAFIHDAELSREETVTLLTAIYMGFGGQLSAKQVEDQVTAIAKVAFGRQK
jgi:hypothetical protein